MTFKFYDHLNARACDRARGRAYLLACAAAPAIIMTAPAYAQSVPDWTCVGNCGVASGADGDVTAPPSGNDVYQWISTFSGALDQGRIDSVGGTNGSLIALRIPDVTIGDILGFNFNYITSDGAGYADYAWAAIYNPLENRNTSYLFTARTGNTENTSPGFGLPDNASITSPQLNPIHSNLTVWSPLGVASGQCYDAGCGSTGWITSLYTIATTDVQADGSLTVLVGVSNWSDTAYDSGVAIDHFTVNGTSVPFTPFVSVATINPTPDIDAAQPFYVASQVGTGVYPNFVNGTLIVDDDQALTQSFTADSATGNTLDLNGHDVTFSGTLSDATAFSGQLNIVDTAGSGRVSFLSSNSVSGVLAVAQNVEVVLADSGQFADLGTLLLDGRIDVTNTARFMANISGLGSLVKSGDGVLMLTGANSYTGGTTVSGGSLIGNSGSMQGAIANDGVVEFVQATNGTYSGAMSGSGRLIKSDSGALTLTGTNSYTGGTTVAGGSLIGNAASLQGVIVNEGVVEFLQATDGTYSGAMSGSGGLIKSDSGALTLTGTNSYTGGTTVAGGSLIGNAASLQGVIVNEGVVEFLQVTDGTYYGAMSGSGGLIKSDVGALTLAGTNSYTGGTTVSGGSLIGNSASLQGAIANEGVVEFAQATDGTYSGAMSGSGGLIKSDAGALILTGTQSYAGGTTVSGGSLIGSVASLQGAITNEGTVEFAQSTDGTYSGAMSGSGRLIKSDVGALTLAGTNSYAGGTTVLGGSLIGNSASLQGAIANEGVVEFAQATDGHYSGAMSGSGALIKSDAGALTLTGTNSYTGGTAVSGGSLIGNSASLQGAITNDGAVEFAQATDGTYAGSMIGSGTLVKSGVGALTMSGQSELAGDVHVTEGRLVVAGSLNSGRIFVESGAAIGGRGSIAGNVAIASGASLEPGNSPGLLSVVGNLELASGSTFAPDIDGRIFSPVGGAGSYDRIVVSGIANLAGSVEPRLRGISGSASNTFTPAIGDSFIVVSAGAISGSFDGLVQPASGLSPGTRIDIRYQPTMVELIVTPSSFSALGNVDGWEANAVHAAAALDAQRAAVGSEQQALRSVYVGLVGQDRAQLQRAVRQLSGSIHATALSTFIRSERAALENVAASGCGTACGAGGDSVMQKSGFWTQLLTQRSVVTDGASTGYFSRDSGFAMGLSIASSATAQIGAAASYTENATTALFGEEASSVDATGYIYGRLSPTDALSVSGVVGIGSGTLRTSRTINALGSAARSTSKQATRGLMADVNAAYRLVQGPVSIWGVAGINAHNIKLDGQREVSTNPDFALRMDATNWKSAEGRLGFRVQTQQGILHAAVTGNWLYEMADGPIATRMVTLGVARWQVQSATTNRQGWNLGSAVSAQLANNVSLNARYETDHLGNNAHQDQVSLGLYAAF